MRLESALFSSKEGLVTHGTAISVIGDNISNSNTVGYKTARVEFADLLAEGGDGRSSQTIPGGGNGVTVKSIRTLYDTGLIEPTGRSLDIAIGGRGFFMVGDVNDPQYTRGGALRVSQEGILVDSNGLNVLGFVGETSEFGVLDTNNLNLSGEATNEVALFGNLASENDTTTVPTAPATFQEVAADASFVANVGVFDSLGAQHEITLAFYKTDASTVTARAYIDGSEVGAEQGIPVQLGQDATLTFNTDGTVGDAAAATIAATPAYSNGAAAGNFSINLSGFTQFSGSTQVASITQDGKSAGNIQDYKIDKAGQVFAVLDTGETLQLGQMRLADFFNPDGLERKGNGLYTAGPDVGALRLGIPGEGGFGVIENNSLERSTVDIVTEFTSLVLFQRGYQASSQTLNATNDMLRDTLSLIR